MIKVWNGDALEHVVVVHAGITAALNGCEVLGALVPAFGDWHGVAHDGYEDRAELLRGRIVRLGAELGEARRQLEATPGLWR